MERYDRPSMQISVTDVTQVEKKIQIQATPEELAPHFEKAYREFQQKSEIKGFRKGKVPMDYVRRVYGEGIEMNSLDSIANDFFRKAVEQQALRPIGEPAMTDMTFKREEGLTFTVQYEVKPDVQLSTYTDLPVEKPVHTVTAKEVESEILRIRRANSTFEETDIASDTEHIVTADIQELDNSGAPLIGKKTPDARFYLAEDEILPEVRDALVGTRHGDIRRTTLQRQHGDHPHTDHLELQVTKVEKVLLPELDDTLVKKITREKVTTVEEFRRNLQDQIEGYWKERSERALENAIVAEIVRRHDFPVPESMVRGIQESLLEELKSRSPNKSLPPDFDRSKFLEANRGYAVFQAKWYLIRERILDAENIRAEEADLAALAEREAPRVSLDKERLLQFYKNSESIRDRIVTDKLMVFLKQRQKVTEKATEDPAA